MTGPVRKAVIPAAGLGTRFLPATKAVPKEMIPVVDKPAVQYIVEEAVRAGIDDILIVTSRGKSSIEDHFDRAPELEMHLDRGGKKRELDQVVAISDLADIHVVRQKEPRGFGDAVMAARRHIGDAAFVVMVGDEIVPEPVHGERDLLQEMIAAFGRTSSSVVAVKEVAPADVTSYGVVDPVSGPEQNLVEIRGMVEKPRVEAAPSRLSARGRYVFEADLFGYIDRTPPGRGGEIQLTDAINAMAQERRVYAYVHEGPIFDVGKNPDYLRASIELALRRADLGPEISAWLKERAATL